MGDEEGGKGGGIGEGTLIEEEDERKTGKEGGGHGLIN